MDKYGGVTFEEMCKALEKLFDPGKTPRETEELNCKISKLSNNKFADEVTDIVAAEHNTYGTLEQIRRMENIIYMLVYGLSQEKIKEIIELQIDDFAVNFIKMERIVNGNEN